MNVLPLSFFVNRLDNREPVSYVRYGDGEFNAILGASGENCDHHQYFAELGADLRRTLVEPREYFYALGPRALRKDGIGSGVGKWLNHNCPQIEWYSSETFLTASLNGQLLPLVVALRKRLVMVVGPSHLRNLRTLGLQPVCHVDVPLVNAYLSKEQIKREILRNTYAVDVILFSAGMTTNVIMWDLYPHLGATHTMLDCGSLWDMYVGVNSRSYARRMPADNRLQLLSNNFGVQNVARETVEA